MSRTPLTYAQLLETNNLIQQNTDETYWLCITRTVQESKLFPVSPYMVLSYFMAFYRYPPLLRKIEQHMKAEEIGNRCRNMGIKIQNPAMGWALPSFYLLGREYLINLGLLRAQDAVEDIVYVMDFWKRFQLAWHRNDAHLTNRDFGHRSQILPERRLQVFHADLYDCTEGDALHTAAQAFMAATSQYGFLVSCESRIALCNQGPYRLDDDREMIVRDFMDLAEGDYPWLDGVGADMPYNNLTVPMAVKGCHFNIVDDWGSFESQPEFKSHHMVAVGLYTSDTLSEGYLPVGMGSREELTQTFETLTVRAKEATAKLWKRIAGWSRDQMMDAGAITYFAIVKDLAHVAGCYEMEDWMLVDERAERFRPLLNDEYANLSLWEILGPLANPAQRLNEYQMCQHADLPARMLSLIPYSILDTGDCTATSGDMAPGITYLPPKEDRYRTTEGVLTLAEYNRRARAFVPATSAPKFENLCESWLKHHYDTPLADELYRLEQRESRTLKDRGAGLRRADVERLRHGK
ncbi:MAG: hypothetical protein HY749_04155 [Gammaproteobacteria bacterium]|nr:hypothetical protein [Gammaproteobacteria bacterium]